MSVEQLVSLNIMTDSTRPQLATEGNTVSLSHAFIQPMAAEDVASAVVEAALAPPANGMIEVGGPEKFHLDELVARVLEYDKDPRKVVTDPDARYSGAKLSENSLIPGKDAKLGSTKFDWWLQNVPPPPKKYSLWSTQMLPRAAGGSRRSDDNR